MLENMWSVSTNGKPKSIIALSRFLSAVAVMRRALFRVVLCLLIYPFCLICPFYGKLRCRFVRQNSIIALNSDKFFERSQKYFAKTMSDKPNPTISPVCLNAASNSPDDNITQWKSVRLFLSHSTRRKVSSLMAVLFLSCQYFAVELDPHSCQHELMSLAKFPSDLRSVIHPLNSNKD